jgi:VWFA-related protein
MPTRLFRIVSAAIMALCLAAQEAPPIRISTRMVELSVVVRSKDGPVRDLTARDFTVLDNGKPQEIKLFSIENASQQMESAGTLPPRTFSNNPQYHGVVPAGLTIVLIDGLNTPFGDQVFGKAELLRFLRDVDPKQPVALYTLGRSLHVLHDFTEDRERLAAAIAKLRARQSFEVSDSDPDKILGAGNAFYVGTDDPETDARIAQALDDFKSLIQEDAQIRRSLVTLEALEAIGNHVSMLPGRKNLIWISGGIPFVLGFSNVDAATAMPGARGTVGGTSGIDADQWSRGAGQARSFASETRRAVRALNRANIAVYPVDARGLVATKAEPSASNLRRIGRRQQPFVPETQQTSGIDSMQTIAEWTGGQASFGNNDVAAAIRKASEDSEVTYTLGFYPGSARFDGKWHELKVRVERKGVEVRSRRGYFAEIPADKTAAEELAGALVSPLESLRIPVLMRAEKDQSDPKMLQVRVAVDPRGLEMEEKEDRHRGEIDAIFVQQDQTGAVLESTRQTAKIDWTPEAWELALRQGALLAKAIRLKPNAVTLRFLVLDKRSGNIGSVIVPLAKLD